MIRPVCQPSAAMRQSNMELLRIVAMMMVLIVHADFWSIGAPTAADYASDYVAASTRTFFECVSIIGVNVFVAISGWFSIKPSVRGLCGFVFQYVFVGLLLTGCAYACLHKRIDIEFVRQAFLLGDYIWFVKAYIGLYILAVPLNWFAERASRRQFICMLSGFYAFQTIYGFTGGAPYIAAGYSAFSFAGIYLAARFCRLHLGDSGSRRLIYAGLGLLAVNFICYNFTLSHGFAGLNQFISYINPAIVVGALAVVVLFDRIAIPQIRTVNFVASSAFAVYLVHQNPQVATTLFKPLFCDIYADYDGLLCLAMYAIALTAIYIVSILIDQPRKWLWSLLKRYI